MVETRDLRILKGIFRYKDDIARYVNTKIKLSHKTARSIKRQLKIGESAEPTKYNHNFHSLRYLWH